MTHDELLELINRKNHSQGMVIHVDTFRDVLRAIVELHKPVVLQNCADVNCCGNGNYCSHCVEEATDYYNHPYPCPTIQAIEKELK